MQNEMRDRLIRALCSVECVGADRREGGCALRKDGGCVRIEGLEMCMVETIADHLLSVGVIAPPCRVGTSLYFLYNSPFADKPDLTPRIYETNEWYFDIDEKGISIKPRWVHGYKGEYHYYLGKTVFLTREEAEKALERSENGT